MVKGDLVKSWYNFPTYQRRVDFVAHLSENTKESGCRFADASADSCIGARELKFRPNGKLNQGPLQLIHSENIYEIHFGKEQIPDRFIGSTAG